MSEFRSPPCRGDGESANGAGSGLGEALLNDRLEYSVRFTHRLRFTRAVLDPSNPVLCDAAACGGSVARALCFIDEGLLRCRSSLADEASAYFDAHRQRLSSAAAPCVVPGGEAVKNDSAALESILRSIHDAKLCRQSYVIVVGGGAVLDIVGYAAAIAHRGVRLIRLPSTTLSQADSGVGVKNGVNAFGKKNYLGTFSPPWAVINDSDLLATLSRRDWRSGFAEAVKVALIKDGGFFDAIETGVERIRRRDSATALPIIRRCAELHVRHIVEGGDAFELSAARPLDFGHWSAHKLEQLTDFRMRHGEAVAIGVALDTTYAALAGVCDWECARRVQRCLSALGFELYDAALENDDTLLAGLDEFREHLGGPLTITLPRGIGQAVDLHEILRDKMLAARDHLADAHSRRAVSGAAREPIEDRS